MRRGAVPVDTAGHVKGEDMFRRIVVGYEGSERSEDALVLGRLLARATGAELIAAAVYQSVGAVAHPDVGRWQEELRAGAERTLEGAGSEVLTRAVESSSPARGLHDLAEAVEADLLVVGSSRRGAVGRLLAGDVADRLLHGAPCAVAVAPPGFAERPPARLATIAVGYDGGPEADGALDSATELARATGAVCRLIGVVDVPDASPETAPAELLEADRERIRSALAEAVSRVPAGVEAHTEVIPGHTERLGNQPGVDLLVIGSRGYGPLRSVLLGSTATGLVHHASCPVVVFPRAAVRGGRRDGTGLAAEAG